MKVAIIGAGKKSLYAIEKAHMLHAEVIVVDDNPCDKARKEANHVIEVNPSDITAVIEALKDERINLCLAEPDSRYQIVMGAVNDALGLSGISSQTASLCSDKYAFHNRMRNRQLRPGHCYLVNKSNVIDPWQMTYPAVLKPRFGYGSRGVHYIETPEQLQELENKLYGDKAQSKDAVATENKESAEAFTRRLKKYMEERSAIPDPESSSDEDYILEEAFGGAEYGIDGIVEGCNFELIMIRKKYLTPAPYRVAVGYSIVVPGEEMRLTDIINDYMSRATEALALKDCMIHADLMIQGRKCAAIELSVHPALSHIHDELMPMVTGIDIYKDFIAYSEGELHNFAPLQMRKMMLHFFNMENCFVHNIPKPDELVLPEKVKIKKWECNIKSLDYLGSIRDDRSLHGRGYYILEGPNEKAMLEAVSIINNSFDIK